MSKARNIVFTSYKKTIEFKEDKINYIVYQKEICPTTKKEHWQGYCELKAQSRYSAIKKMFNDNKLHIEVRKGTQQQAIDYCKKVETSVEGSMFEWGEPKKQGKRTDLTAFITKMSDKGLDKAIDEYPETYVKYHAGMDKLNVYNIKKKNTDKLIKMMKKIKLRDWQAKAVKSLLAQDSRKIIWVNDPKGNNGKTFLSKYLIAMHNGFYVMNGKNADIAHSYNYEPIVIFDYSRSQEEHINYGIIEQLKNGIIFSPKYNSHTKLTDNTKIICFANFAPDLEKLSQDRWELVNLENVSEVVGNTNHHFLKPLRQKKLSIGFD